METVGTSERGLEIEHSSVEIASYLDGELSADAELRLESHLAQCSMCAEELNFQKHLLNALESSLADLPEIPADFTKRIVVNAESEVGGLRKKREWLNAAFVCCALFLFILFTLGASAPATIAASVNIVGRMAAILDIIGHLIYDISIGVVVIMRTVAGQPEFGFVALAVIVTLIIGLVCKLSLTRSSRDRSEIFESGIRS